jgi:hypothetical protein
MSKPIVVQVTRNTDAWPKGTELGFDSEAKATSALGEGAFKVIGYQDKSEYTAPVAPQKAADEKKG